METNSKKKFVKKTRVLQRYVKPVFDKDGWANANEYKPFPFDLVMMKDKRGKTQHGWWTGTIWDYANKKIGEIHSWKCSEY